MRMLRAAMSSVIGEMQTSGRWTNIRQTRGNYAFPTLSPAAEATWIIHGVLEEFNCKRYTRPRFSSVRTSARKTFPRLRVQRAIQPNHFAQGCPGTAWLTYSACIGWCECTQPNKYIREFVAGGLTCSRDSRATHPQRLPSVPKLRRRYVSVSCRAERPFNGYFTGRTRLYALLKGRVSNLEYHKIRITVKIAR